MPRSEILPETTPDSGVQAQPPEHVTPADIELNPALHTHGKLLFSIDKPALHVQLFLWMLSSSELERAGHTSHAMPPTADEYFPL